MKEEIVVCGKGSSGGDLWGFVTEHDVALLGIGSREFIAAASSFEKLYSLYDLNSIFD
jgi:hypothetical protein